MTRKAHTAGCCSPRPELVLFSFVILPLILGQSGGGCGNSPGILASLTQCNTSYYDADFSFGFDLPPFAVLKATGPAPGLLTYNQWQVEYGLGGIWFQTYVQNVDQIDLAGFGNHWATSREESGATISFAGLITVANNDTGYLVMYRIPEELLGNVVYFDLFVAKNRQTYGFMTFVHDLDYTETALRIMEDAVYSFCVD
jgi:hypothetical protein